MNGLLGRALLAFLALPGTVAFLVPWMLRRADSTGRIEPAGLIPLTLGVVLLLWCVRDFYVSGKGTVAPWSPPRQLVVIGLYRFSRNPIYIGVMLILCGWAITYRSQLIAVYAAIVMVAFHLRVVLAEEPWLARTHGDEWRRYRMRVPRWLGIRPWR